MPLKSIIAPIRSLVSSLYNRAFPKVDPLTYNAYSQGYNDKMDNPLYYRNPYEPGTPEHRAYDRGFNRADFDIDRQW